MCLPSHAV
jgi:hypothetical protein